jgi:hypothetical protein
VQFFRQFGRRHQVFLGIVETAAVHRPQLAGHAFARSLPGLGGRMELSSQTK